MFGFKKKKKEVIERKWKGKERGKKKRKKEKKSFLLFGMERTFKKI